RPRPRRRVEAIGAARAALQCTFVEEVASQRVPENCLRLYDYCLHSGHYQYLG
ncbi:hypothetical protein PISMIDRAFT_687441, partial [Pisolithus microcarpus 441]